MLHRQRLQDRHTKAELLRVTDQVASQVQLYNDVLRLAGGTDDTRKPARSTIGRWPLHCSTSCANRLSEFTEASMQAIATSVRILQNAVLPGCSKISDTLMHSAFPFSSFHFVRSVHEAYTSKRGSICKSVTQRVCIDCERLGR